MPRRKHRHKNNSKLRIYDSRKHANFNDVASEVSTLLYYLDHKYEVKESNDSRFIPGRQAAIIVKDKQVGIFGEVNPKVLENWVISMPCVAGELNLEDLM